jgi:hypothetical protein
MKVIVIPDIHGNVEMVDRAISMLPECDKMIFLGDYTDSFKATNEDILTCVKKVIELKVYNGDKVTLLLGNHDYTYKESPDYYCSGHRPEMIDMLKPLFNTGYFYNHKLINGYLFTHAGITERWIDQAPYKIENESFLFKALDESEMTQQGRDWLNQVGYARGGMRYNAGGIFWADKTELDNNAYFSEHIKHQVVGHTCLPQIKHRVINEENSIYYVDNQKNEFLTINI